MAIVGWVVSWNAVNVSGPCIWSHCIFFLFPIRGWNVFFSEDFYSMLTLRDFLAHRSKLTYGKKMNPIRPLDRTLLVAPTPSPMRPRPAVSSEGPLFRSSHTVCIYTWFNNILPPFFYICRSWLFLKISILRLIQKIYANVRKHMAYLNYHWW